MHIRKGVKLLTESEGEGRIVTRGDLVKIRTSGWLNKGKQIQPELESVEIVGSRNLIPGIEYSLMGMKEGGKRRVRICPHLAYGKDGIGGKIPPNALLVYEIEVLEIIENT